MSFVAQDHVLIVRQRVRDAVLRRQAGLPPLHDHGEILETVEGLFSEYERRIERLEEELSAHVY